MVNNLLLLSGLDIPFLDAQVNIHQPTIKEISLISEESFHSGCSFLNFSKDLLPEEDKIGLENKSDFEIFMSMMNTKEKAQFKTDTLLLLTLLFPNHSIKFEPNRIILTNLSLENNPKYFIHLGNYDAFKSIIIDMFCLTPPGKGDGEYNPADGFAAKIAAKLKARHDKLKKQHKEKDAPKEIFNLYISILAVGEQKDINSLMNYTVYQLTDEFTRYQKKLAYDMHMQAIMAGATDLDEVEYWMDDIHSK